MNDGAFMGTDAPLIAYTALCGYIRFLFVLSNKACVRYESD